MPVKAVSLAVITALFTLLYAFSPTSSFAGEMWWWARLSLLSYSALANSSSASIFGGLQATSTYGAAGSVIVLLLWVYYSSQVVLLGAELRASTRIMKGGGRAGGVCDEGSRRSKKGDGKRHESDPLVANKPRTSRIERACAWLARVEACAYEVGGVRRPVFRVVVSRPASASRGVVVPPVFTPTSNKRLGEQLGEDGAPDRALHESTLHDSTLDGTTLHGLLHHSGA